MITKNKLKVKRMIAVFFLIISLIGTGYFLDKNGFISFLLLISALILGNLVDNYNIQLEYGIKGDKLK